MITVVVGSTFKNTITPAPVTHVPTVREPAHVTSNPYDTLTQLKALQKKVRGIKLEYPSVLESSSYPDRTKPMYAYRIQDNDRAVRLVFRTGGGAYWGIEQTNFDRGAGARPTRASATCSRAAPTTSTTTARSCT